MQSPKAHVSDTIPYCFDPKKVILTVGLLLSWTVSAYHYCYSNNK